MVELNETRWYEYAAECNSMGIRASISDYLVWLDEQDNLPEYDLDRYDFDPEELADTAEMFR